VVLGLTVMVVVLVIMATRSHTTATRAGLNYNDVYALHDLLLVGWSAVFMRNCSSGQTSVRDAVHQVTQLLPSLHPSASCRASLAAQALPPSSSHLDAVAWTARECWSCLPAHFTADDFSAVFDVAAVQDQKLQVAAKNPQIVSESKKAALGTCQASTWARTCSYWTSLHAMAARGEALGLDGTMLLQAMITTMAGGATQCRG